MDVSRSRQVVVLIGDLQSNFGPATVNRHLLVAANGFFHGINSKTSVHQYLANLRYIRHSRAIMLSSISIRHAMVGIVARVTGKRVVYLAHGVVGREPSGKLIRQMKRTIVERVQVWTASRIVAVSPRLATDMRGRFRSARRKTLAIPNASVFESDSRPEARASIELTRQVSCLTVGTAPVKNLRAILDAVDRVHGLGIALKVVGTPWPDRQAYSSAFIEWVGELESAKLAQLMSRSDIYIQASHSETFGLAICEAVEAGCLVVVPRHAGCLPYLSGMAKFQVIDDVSDVSEIAQKLRESVEVLRDGRRPDVRGTRTWQDAIREYKAALYV